jgi:hypothetical protein
MQARAFRSFVGLLFESAIERGGYPCEVLDKNSVVIEHAEDFLSLLYRFREWYSEDRFDLFRLRRETEASDMMTKNLDVVVTKVKFRLLESATNFRGVHRRSGRISRWRSPIGNC